jgi:hypothetical protein
MNTNGLNFQRLFDAAWAASEQRSWTFGYLGYRDFGTPTSTIVDPDRPGFLFVTLDSGEVVSARNLGVPRLENLPVKMRFEKGNWNIHGIDAISGALEDYLTGPGSNPSGVNPHTHSTTSELSYPIETIRIDAGRLTWAGAMLVTIGQFRYLKADGLWKTWLAKTVNLASWKPMTSGEWGWAIVGVDSLLHKAVVYVGDSQPYAEALTIEQLDEILVPSHVIPCGALKLRNDTTSTSDPAIYADARGWINGGAGGGGGEEEELFIENIQDIFLDDPQPNDMLVYDAGEEGWVNVPAFSELASLDDTAIFSPVEGQILEFGGTFWSNAYPAGIYAPAQVDKAANTTLSDIHNLSKHFIEDGYYKFRAVLHIAADATGGLKIGFATQGTITTFICQVTLIDNTANSVTVGQRITSLATTISQVGPTEVCCILEGFAEAGDAGLFTIQFAQQVASGTSSILLGSTLEATLMQEIAP